MRIILAVGWQEQTESQRVCCEAGRNLLLHFFVGIHNFMPALHLAENVSFYILALLLILLTGLNLYFIELFGIFSYFCFERMLAFLTQVNSDNKWSSVNHL